jgi:hypothetical protein
MKTLSELNEKWWYRLLKVAYIILFITSLISALVIPYAANSSFTILDPENTTISCNVNSDKVVDFSIEDVGSYYFDINQFNGGKFLYKDFFTEYGNEY